MVVIASRLSFVCVAFVIYFSLISYSSLSLSLFSSFALSLVFLGLCLVFAAPCLTRYFLDYDAFLRWFVAGCSWNARLWLASLGMLCDGDECVLRRVEKWRSKMAIENGDRKMAIEKWWSLRMLDRKVVVVVVVVSRLFSHFLSSLLYSFVLVLRLSYDFLYL